MFRTGMNYLQAGAARLLRPTMPLADLLTRLYVAKVFLLSGLTKLSSWDNTLMLFTEEYHVPLLPPGMAAILGTGAELVLPVLLLVGFLTPLAALGLGLLNIVALIAYYHVLQDMPIAIQDHVEWGLMLMLVMGTGSNYFRLDNWLVFQRSTVQR